MGKRILVTGACGQIGSELVVALRERYGVDRVVESSRRLEDWGAAGPSGPWALVDVTDRAAVDRAAIEHEVGTIFHLAALLSAVAERDPQAAWEVNLGGLFQVLESARARGCCVFTPSSIGAFGPSTPREGTPQDTLQRPTTMYGVTKVAGELVCDYYHHRFGVDTRGVRYPGIISHVTEPGGGTTDYAVAIFYEALLHGRYTCFLAPDTRLDMMYMPDALNAAITLMEAPAERLEHRNAFNVAAMSFSPEELAEAIRAEIPRFEIRYQVDPVRQAIADSWPRSIDDSAARIEWGWKPRYELSGMVRDMLENLEKKLRSATLDSASS